MKRIAFASAALAVALCAFSDSAPSTRVSISSQPSGAAVTVDGRDCGTTPTMLFDLKPGRHHVKYRLKGYVERDRFIRAEDGPFIECSETLEEEKGLLLVRTEPEGCSILIDGYSAGQTPRLVTNLSAKDAHTVRLRKAGYLDQTISVRFDGRKPLVRTETLVLASGVVSVASDPPGAEVTVNGVERGRTPLEVSGVPKGRAVVKFRLEGFEDETRELAINAGDRQTLQVAMKGLPGTLLLTSVPAGARFYVNNVPRGNSPVTLTGLAPGDYSVRAEMEGYADLSRTVTIANGASLSEEFRLSGVMGRLEVRTSPVGAKVLLDGRLVGTTRSDDPAAEFSDVLPIEGVPEGEHALVVRKDGYAESVRHPKIRSKATSKANVRLRRVFRPDTEIVTARGSYKGVLVSVTPESVVLEVSLGITRSFAKDEIRRMETLAAGK
ncbi:MAG: PEGA domain-containing protein [Kiritimatiellae bacterium]|nr:PEGA domain-containing protein [Kiritimatiellia bacterium]